jgi:hypothetical protein
MLFEPVAPREFGSVVECDGVPALVVQLLQPLLDWRPPVAFDKESDAKLVAFEVQPNRGSTKLLGSAGAIPPITWTPAG